MYLKGGTCNKTSFCCREQTHVRAVREAIQCTVPSDHAHEDTYRGETLPVSRVWERLHAEGAHEVSHVHCTPGILQSCIRSHMITVHRELFSHETLMVTVHRELFSLTGDAHGHCTQGTLQSYLRRSWSLYTGNSSVLLEMLMVTVHRELFSLTWKAHGHRTQELFSLTWNAHGHRTQELFSLTWDAHGHRTQELFSLTWDAHGHCTQGTLQSYLKRSWSPYTGNSSVLLEMLMVTVHRELFSLTWNAHGHHTQGTVQSYLRHSWSLYTGNSSV